MKYCWYCGQERDRELFGSNKSKYDGYNDMDRECQNRYRKARRAKNRVNNIKAKRTKQKSHALARTEQTHRDFAVSMRETLRDVAIENAYHIASQLPGVIDMVIPTLEKILKDPDTKNHERLKAVKEIVNIVSVLMPKEMHSQVINNLNIPGLVYLPNPVEIKEENIIEMDVIMDVKSTNDE